MHGFCIPLLFSYYEFKHAMSTLSKLNHRKHILELEVGQLRMIRKSPNPEHSIVAGELELERQQEIERLAAEIAEIKASGDHGAN